MASLLIATPCYGKVVGEGYLHSYIATQDLLRSKGHQIKLHTVGNESLITRARNNQVAHFLSTQFDYLMFIDADITWPPKAVLELLESGHDVCGIPYPTKGRDWSKVIKFVKEKVSSGLEPSPQEVMNNSLSYTINRIPNVNDAKNGWLQVDALGTGFFMIKRRVLEEMRDHYRQDLNYKNDVKGYQTISPEEHCVGVFETMIDPSNRRYLSEDYAFCKRWREIGGKIFSLLKYKLTHTGATDF